MLGYSRNEIIGKHISLITPPELRSEPQDSQAKLLKGESVVRMESMRQRKDGKLIHVAIAVSPIRDEGGRIVGARPSCGTLRNGNTWKTYIGAPEATFRSFVENAPY